MRVALTSMAEAEVAAAIDWYEAEAPGIGIRFDALLRRVANNPAQFPRLRGDVRRAGLPRFPYGLLFRTRHDVVEVFACFHVSRDPRSWQTRL